MAQIGFRRNANDADVLVPRHLHLGCHMQVSYEWPVSENGMQAF